ncbi:MAG: hypothetical protein AB7I32_03090 [Gammaproteobacteria bacterium]
MIGVPVPVCPSERLRREREALDRYRARFDLKSGVLESVSSRVAIAVHPGGGAAPVIFTQRCV